MMTMGFAATFLFMSYPAIQIPRQFVWYGESLPYLLQTVALSTSIDINVYALDDTTFTTSLFNDATQSTDGNGDFSGSIPITTRATFPIGCYVLRITVGADHHISLFNVERTSIYLQLMDSLLGGLKFLPRFAEHGALSLDRTYVRLPYGNIQLTPAPVFTKNDGSIVDSSQAKLDYAAGRLYLLNPTTEGDEFRAEYRFSYLSDADAYAYLRLGLHQANNKSPATNYSLSTAVVGFEYPVSFAAYRMTLRKLIADLGTFQWKRCFDSPETLLSSAQAMYTSTGPELDVLLAGIKRRGILLPGVVRSADIANMPSLATGSGGLGEFRSYSVLGGS